MPENVNAEVVTIGTEILLGELTDTNTTHIARVLRDIGVNLYYTTSVGDNRGRIAEVIQAALARADVVITCGGLGPTVDDMTRQGVADAVGRDLVFHETLLEQIAARFASFKVPMTENNRRQAYLPADAIVIENPVGTAPSFIVEVGSKAIISLPGVPREMKYLMAERVVPYLQQKYALGIIKARILRTAGIGESLLDEMIGNALLEQSNPTVGLAAHSGQVDVRVTAKAETVTLADAMIAEVETQLMARIGKYVFGHDDEKLSNAVIALLRANDWQAAVVTAGLDAAALTDDLERAGVLHSVRHYAQPSDIQPYTSLRELADTTAVTVQALSHMHLVMVVLSQPDVDENPDSAESTAVAVLVGEKHRTRAYGFGGRNPLLREWVSTWALASAWRMLREESDNA